MSLRKQHVKILFYEDSPDATVSVDDDIPGSTVILGRLAGFGGAPNMGHDPKGRRHSTPAWLSLITADGDIVRGRKLVVQLVETFSSGGVPALVSQLDAVEVGRQAHMPIAPVMIYGDDVSHVVSEEGIAYLYKAQGQEERRAAHLRRSPAPPPSAGAPIARALRSCARAAWVAYPEDLGVRRTDARRSLLAARSIEDLVAWSGGLYRPPTRFLSW